ncbi:SDR family oxidoreductase [Allorhizocola rhizosphaerae]|uniref:SDR family oxidoreductase n=1 Tax=Allorhizocola rhizosphaerae TaxID=1872709 RepID=UPI000E3E8047|nr:SDR family oxidoreductase [Allorhizocola rhizosphaerae]
MTDLLGDKVVAISGVGPGLGQALARQCASAGAHVVLAARTASYVEELAKELDGMAVPLDVTAPDAGASLLAAYGRVDTLVHNAFAMPSMRELSKVDTASLVEGFEVNVFAALRLTQQLAPALVESRGSVVFVNSAVLRHSRRTFGAYKMTKAALLAVAQSLSTELGPKGVRVNSIAPSYIWSEKLEQYFAFLAQKRGVTPETVYDEAAANVDLRRLLTPAEIADVVVFLASDLARGITGQCIDVNGGEFHR